MTRQRLAARAFALGMKERHKVGGPLAGAALETMVSRRDYFTSTILFMMDLPNASDW